MNFARGGGGDHLSLMRCYNEWQETNFSTQWCYENYLQVMAVRQVKPFSLNRQRLFFSHTQEKLMDLWT